MTRCATGGITAKAAGGVNLEPRPGVGSRGWCVRAFRLTSPSGMMGGPRTPDTRTDPMLLTITTTHRPATDLGYLLHKHPDRFQSFDLSFGKAHVFYPEAADDRCTACLLLDVDPVGMVRGKGVGRGPARRSTSTTGPTPPRRS